MSIRQLWWNMERIGHLTCRSDLRIAINATLSRESEFPPAECHARIWRWFTDKYV